MRLSEQYIKNALSLALEILQTKDSSKIAKVWENTIKAIVAYAQEKSGKEVLAYALAFSLSLQSQDFKSDNFFPIITETLKVAEKIGIEDPEVKELYEKVKAQTRQSSS